MAEGSNASVEYLSDNQELMLYVSQGWGELGIDTCAYTQGQAPLPMRIGNKTYAKGLGHHAPGEIVVELEGRYQTFEAEVGVQWQGGHTGSVVFQVFVDDEKRFDSGVMREKDEPKAVNVDVTGAYELKLVVSDAGDGITCDCANWAEARLVAVPSAASQVERELMDISPFGRICTWDPNRTDGCRASRIEEFHSEDLFLESDIEPAKDGMYIIPEFEGGLACIGHQWLERRRFSRLEMAFGADSGIPHQDNVRLEAWVGESLWQGNWKPLAGKVTVQGNKLVFELDRKANPESRKGYWKVRWILPPSDATYCVHRPVVLKPVRWQAVECFLHSGMPDWTGVRIEAYNALLDDCPQNELSTSLPTKLRIRYAGRRPGEADRPALRFTFSKFQAGVREEGIRDDQTDSSLDVTQNGDSGATQVAFAVSVDDLVSNKHVYVPEVSFLATTDPKMTLAKYEMLVSGRKTILERVREMPDQTFEQAMQKTHNPIQDNGPTMLSLACDNRKFLVQQNGRVFFHKPVSHGLTAQLSTQFECAMTPQFGCRELGRPERHLDGGWMPILTSTFADESVTYRQRCFVTPVGTQVGNIVWFNDKALFVSEFAVTNSGGELTSAQLRLDFHSSVRNGLPAKLKEVSKGALVTSENDILALVQCDFGRVSAKLGEGSVTVSGQLVPGQEGRVVVYIPGWRANESELMLLPEVPELLEKVRSYWEAILRPAMQIHLPDPFLDDVIRASQVHCLIAARNEDGGTTVAPWIASMSYGPLESEANSIIRGMAYLGHVDFARRSLEFFIRRYNPAGFLTTGYTLMGTGWHLWSLGEYYALTRDKLWVRRVAEDVRRVCDWIVRQRAKTKKLDSHGRKLPEYGLMPPGVMADWNAFNYHFCLNGYYYAGLKSAALALQEIGDKEATEFLQVAEEFRQEIVRAYHWTQSLSPVIPLQDGTWVKAYPGRLHCPGPTGDFYPGEDSNRSWCYDVELGAHQLVPQGVLDSGSREVGDMLDHMEDVQFLADGWFDYPAERNHADWFNLGGFAKVQPYYCRNAEVYALRDDVKPFIRSYFNALASLLNTENLSLWEHFHNAGAFNKTHETGYFLYQTRTMLIQERGNDLWLAPFVTDRWFSDGDVVEVRNAPTSFGPVSYHIESQISKGRVLATVDLSERNPPASVVMRVRHPDGMRIKSVRVNGRDHHDFDPLTETVVINGAKPGLTSVVIGY